MAATVINYRGGGPPGGYGVHTIYTNSTGGNVRIIFQDCGSMGGSGNIVFRYGDPSHAGGENGLIYFTLPANTRFGKNLAVCSPSNTFSLGGNGAYATGGAPVAVPTEIMLADTHILKVDVASGIDDWGFQYSILVIPEGN